MIFRHGMYTELYVKNQKATTLTDSQWCQSEYSTTIARIQAVPVATASASVRKFGLNSVVMAAFYWRQFREHVNSFPSPKTERINVLPHNNRLL